MKCSELPRRLLGFFTSEMLGSQMGLGVGAPSATHLSPVGQLAPGPLLGPELSAHGLGFSRSHEASLVCVREWACGGQTSVPLTRAPKALSPLAMGITPGSQC